MRTVRALCRIIPVHRRTSVLTGIGSAIVPSKVDRRLVIVELTPQGQALVEWVFPKFNQGEIEVASFLSDEEQETLAHLLRKVVSGLNAQIEDVPDNVPDNVPDEEPTPT